MTAKTSELLAQRLDDAGLEGLAEMARADMFHDFLSPLDLPEMELEAALRAARDSCPDGVRRVKIEDIRLDLIDGRFDASTEESDEWAASAEGQAAFRSLIRKP
jgi:hypothetical protein